jgi:hypothetical protein
MITLVATSISSLAVAIGVYELQQRLEDFVAKRHAND